MFRTVIWFGHFALSLVCEIFPLLKVNSLEKQGKSKEKDAYVHKVTSKWAKSQLKYSVQR